MMYKIIDRFDTLYPHVCLLVEDITTHEKRWWWSTDVWVKEMGNITGIKHLPKFGKWIEEEEMYHL